MYAKKFGRAGQPGAQSTTERTSALHGRGHVDHKTLHKTYIYVAGVPSNAAGVLMRHPRHHNAFSAGFINTRGGKIDGSSDWRDSGGHPGNQILIATPLTLAACNRQEKDSVVLWCRMEIMTQLNFCRWQCPVPDRLATKMCTASKWHCYPADRLSTYCYGLLLCY